MILALGHDLVEIQRFTYWHTYSRKKLLRIYSEREITYCLQESQKSAERFAVRFAAKEGLYKALFQAGIHMPFLTVCKKSEIVFEKNGPVIRLYIENSPIIHTSLTHTESYASATIILVEDKI